MYSTGKIILALCLLTFSGCFSGDNSPVNYSQAEGVNAFVDPFMGTTSGNIFPGASLPFGMVKVGPDILPPQPTSGYRPGQPIAGFSHNHTSGTGGGPRYGNILAIPQVGPVNLDDYASVKNVNERAFPGYYGVTLARKTGDVIAEVTATRHVGAHKYTCFTWDDKEQIEGSIFIDVAHTVTRAGLNDARCTEAYVEIVSDDEIMGYASFAGGWGGQNPYKVYFIAGFDKKFTRSGVWNQSKVDRTESRLSIQFDEKFPVKNRRMGAYAGFDLKQNETIEMKVAISYAGLGQARRNLEKVRHKSFDEIYAESDQKWEEYLSRISVKGGLPEHRQLFYSSLRNTMLMPSDVTGQVPEFEGEIPHYWDHYCIWDVFRTVMPLHTLILPEEQRRMLNGLLNIYEKKGWLPDSWVAGHYGDIQGGTNVDVVFADAILKDLGGFDYEKAFEAVCKNAEVPSDKPKNYGRYLGDYLELGYITSSSTNGASSKTLEYAYNDFCIAKIAEELGHSEIREAYLERSQKVFKLFNDSVKHFWAKDRQGNWQPGITSENLRADHWNDPYFYEAPPFIYSTYVPHDMQGLIDRIGGAGAYVDYLDYIFDERDFKMSNEPLFLVPYQYIYAGRHDKTAERLQNIMRNQYKASPSGLPGQDDSGAMSSWFVFSSMGFFPVAGQDIYLIGSPLFSESFVNLENDACFRIVAENLSHENIYVQSATLNGNLLEKAWFRHEQIAEGGELVLKMGDEPRGWGEKNLPPSIGQ